MSARWAALTAAALLLLSAVASCAALPFVVTADVSSGAARTGAMARPVDGAVVTQGYGCTAYSAEPISPPCPGGHFHSGIDLGVPMGTPVRATLGGMVHVQRSATGFGLHIIIDHGTGFSSLYGHLSQTAVVDGQAVTGGEIIGAVGSTGNSSGPHLHFEIRRGGIPEDPAHDVGLP